MSIVDSVQSIIDAMGALGRHIPGKAMLDYLGCVVKRVLEPQLNRYEAYQEARTQEALFTKYPLKRIEFCQKVLSGHPEGIPEVSMQTFENLLKIGERAQAFLQADKKAEAVAGDGIDDVEWLSRFVDEAGYVTDERLQEVFGRLLKEKIVRPGAVNKRVLRILCDIDASELDTIQKYMSCFVGEGIATSIMSKFDFGLDMMLELQNIGLMSIVTPATPFEEIYTCEDISPEKNVIEAKGWRFVFSNIKEPFKTQIPSYVLTKEGKIVYGLVALPMREDVANHYLGLFRNDCGDRAEVALERVEM